MGSEWFIDIMKDWLRMNGCAWVRMVHNGFGMGNTVPRKSLGTFDLFQGVLAVKRLF